MDFPIASANNFLRRGGKLDALYGNVGTDVVHTPQILQPCHSGHQFPAASLYVHVRPLSPMELFLLQLS